MSKISNKITQMEFKLNLETVHKNQCTKTHKHSYHNAFCITTSIKKGVSCKAHCEIDCKKGGHAGHTNMMTPSQRRYCQGYVDGYNDTELMR